MTQEQQSKEVTSPATEEQRYVMGLERFLGASQEDTVDVEGLLSQLPKYVPGFLEYLQKIGSGKILDVGSGNGAKAIYLAKQLEQKGIHMTVDSIEPKADQRRALQENYSRDTNQRYLSKVFQQPLGSEVPKSKYEFVLVIHALYEFPRYEDGTIVSLEKLGSLLQEDGVGVIITEHPDGDFQRMKRELYSVFGKQEPVSQHAIAQTFKAAGIPYQVGDIIEFTFDLTNIINLPETEIGRHLAFLFSDSLMGTGLTDEQLARVGQWAKQNVRRDGERAYLWTPDIAIWFWRKETFQNQESIL